MTDAERRILLALMATGSTRADAAKTANVPAVEIDRLMNDPAFVAELDRMRNAAFNESLARLKSGTGRAVAKLLALVNSRSDGESRRAAVDVINLAVRIRENDELEKRLEQIESRLAATRPGKNHNTGGNL